MSADGVIVAHGIRRSVIAMSEVVDDEDSD
jgi:hypothetical protein